MATKNPKVVYCRNCNHQIFASAPFCPFCGVKRKKPFYRRIWFIFLVILFLLIIGGKIFGGSGTRLKDSLPEAESFETLLTVAAGNISVSAPASEKKFVPSATSDNAAVDDLSHTSTPVSVSTMVNPAAAEPTEAVGSQNGNNSGIDPDFKAAMDSYEAFFDEYVEFMRKYKESDNSILMLADYTSFLTKYTQAMSDLEKMKTNDLSVEEFAYYTEVMLRINQKLLTVAY